MNYRETLDWLYGRLPSYQRVGAPAYKKDLGNTLALAAHLGDPHKNFTGIHVAGTNGKGSVCHMLASVLQEAGYKTGLYTSPHLKDFRERIKINGRPVEKEYVTAFVRKHQSFFEQHALSFFEMTVGLAFDYFSHKKTDLVVVETGLGGRLDSTNIITPALSVITNIGKDHMRFLGNTLAGIAAEKAGIIKPGIPVVIGEKQPEACPVFTKKAAETGADIYFAEDFTFKRYPLDLLGHYQDKNRQTALAALQVLSRTGLISVGEKHITGGLSRVIPNTGLQGRWQILRQRPKVICDTAHNAEGLQYVLAQLREEFFEKLHIVLGMVSDKAYDEILPLFPKGAHYYFCRPDIPRGLDAGALQDMAASYELKGEAFATVKEAYSAALKNAGSQDLVFVGGSTFVVAEVL